MQARSSAERTLDAAEPALAGAGIGPAKCPAAPLPGGAAPGARYGHRLGDLAVSAEPAIARGVDDMDDQESARARLSRLMLGRFGGGGEGGGFLGRTAQPMGFPTFGFGRRPTEEGAEPMLPWRRRVRDWRAGRRDDEG